jgi:iron complex outermembrane recepter protein
MKQRPLYRGSGMKKLAVPAFLGLSAWCAQVCAQTALEEVVVTARKRAESLQDVPLSVSAIAGAQLENLGIQNATELYARVPGLYFAQGSITNPTGPNTYLTMRGVGWNAGLEPAIGVFIDGMYQPQIGFDLAFLDLERVEVLRGPQGTLFGRNTQGGALSMVTRKPDQSFRGTLRMEYAEFDTTRVQGSMSGPFSDELAGSVSVEYFKTDGFIRNATLGRDQAPSERTTARAMLRWTPTEDLAVMFIGDASQKDYNEMMRGVPLSQRESKDYISFGDEDGQNDQADNRGAQLNVDFNLSENITLSSISGLRKSESDITPDTDSRITDQAISIIPAVPPVTRGPTALHGATTPFSISQRFASQELRLAGTYDRWDWLGGLYYFDQKTLENRFRFLGANVAFPFAVYIEEHFFEKRDGWAAFGQTSFRPIEKLELTAGVRYSDEDVETGGLRLIYTAAPALTDKAGTTGGDNVSFMGSVGYEFTDNLNMYVTYAEGWKAGGINRNPSNRAGVVPYEDESSKNYEVGFKTSWFEKRVAFNGAIYKIDIENQQVFNFIPSPVAGGTPVSAVENAASSEVKGAEVEIFAQLVKGLTFEGSYGYSNTEFNDYTRVFSAADRFVMNGLNFENIPETTASAGVTWEIPVFGPNRVELGVDWRYVGRVTLQDNFIGATSRNQSFIPSYDRLDVRVSYVTDSGWRFSGYVDNVLDSWDYVGASSDPYRFALFPVYAQPLPPRQFGVVIAKSFK